MSTINFRIKQLVEHFAHGNNSEFGKLIDVNEANVRNYINGTEPKFNIIERIAKKFEISFEWLLLGIEPMLANKNLVKIQNTPQSFENRVPQVITVDSHNEDNIVLVPVKARAGYLNGYYKPEFIRTLPSYRLPAINNGIFRMFEVKGQSMGNTLPSKSIAVGEWVDNWVNNIKDGRIYIIIYDDGDKMEDGILIKRCLNRIKKYNNLVCKSDNLDKASYPNISIDPEHIKEVWELKSALKFEFPDPSDLYGRINHLEAESHQIKTLLKQLANNQGLIADF